MSLSNNTGLNSSGNSSSIAGCKSSDDGDSSYAKFFIALACCVIMLVSLLGNSAVIAVVASNKRMWTTTNSLIANMAASDLLIYVFAMPREFTEIFAGGRRWLIEGLAGLALCKIVFFFQDISIAVSIQSLVAIAIDRYRGVVFPFRPPIITSKLCKIIIPLIWIMAMGVHGTYFYTVRLVTRDNKSYCTFSWAPAFDNRRTQEQYFMVVSVVLVLFPLCSILTLYGLVILELRKSKLKSIHKRSSSLRSQRQREDAKIMKKIVAIVVLFALCISPITIVGILFYYVWDWHIPCGMGHLMLAAKYIFYSNAALNPTVYFLLNERYWKGLKQLVNCLVIRRPARVQRNDIEMNIM